MRTSIKLSILSLLFISLLDVSLTEACTIITASNSDKVLFAGNQDQPPVDSYLVVDKTGTFGVVYFASPWPSSPLPLVMMKGINEKGLSYDTNWIPKDKLIPHPERIGQYEWAVLTLMQETSSVEEVLLKIFRYNFGNSMEYQLHLADKSGDAVVIHPGADGEVTYTRKPKGNGYLISTNFNLVQLDRGNWSCRRYETADKMLSNIGTQGELTVDFMASVLKATHQKTTLYSAVYDLQSLSIYLYYNRQYDKSYVLDVTQELAKTKSYREVTLKDLISDMERQKKKK